ncbi:TetR/AcrR family transcriptional regulator [Ruania halotolerans]|uniref:TetR/AcrR family transcriptional regulator n=1 Tax=Ruania halotolerans TaxID=2897773 RepID=UPI001E322B02|nr:TetR family transcriptional regulator [Ruania halotolerans]UFU06120.1 TetR family transcriptional regulator [Ruania halotolerans]
MSNEERRTTILDAVERLLGRGGIAAVTMREVAAEAGVSLRLVQYYGKSKDELLTAALERLATRSASRWQARRDSSATAGSLAAEIRAFFEEALPTDEMSRSFHRVGVSLELLAVTSADTPHGAYDAHLGSLADHLTEVCRAAEPGLDEAQARQLAVETMALCHGLGSLLMTGQVSAADVEAIVTRYVGAIEENRV